MCANAGVQAKLTLYGEMRTKFATNLSAFLHQMVEQHANRIETALASNSLNLLDADAAPYAIVHMNAILGI